MISRSQIEQIEHLARAAGLLTTFGRILNRQDLLKNIREFHRLPRRCFISRNACKYRIGVALDNLGGMAGKW
jgi:hypothetical protein